jgi:hypothetical protein
MYALLAAALLRMLLIFSATLGLAPATRSLVAWCQSSMS